MIKCFLTKNNLNNIEVLICKAIINSYINHDKVVSVNNMLREYNEMKEEIKNPKCDGYQRRLASMICKSFDKGTGSGASVNPELAQELHKPMIKKPKRQYLGSRFSWNGIIM